ncbi:MAG: TOBE domain-containing protein, partial [Candidatus Limnocylindrales bacterium]
QAPAGRSGTLKGRADVVEYLGSQELIHVDAAGHDIVALIDSENRVQVDDVMSLFVELDKVHIFDPESGLSVSAIPVMAAA